MKALAIVALSTVLFLSTSSLFPLVNATPLPSPGDSDLAAESTHIVIGKVTKLESFWNEDRSWIYTLTTFAAFQVLKGTIRSSSLIVKTLGGDVTEPDGSGASMSAMGQAQFSVGEELKLFLRQNQDSSFSVVRGVLGRVSIESSGIQYSGFGGAVAPGYISGYDYSAGRRWGRIESLIYWINDQGTADTAGEFAAVNAAIQTWVDDPLSSVTVNYQGTGGFRWAQDGLSVIDWGTDFPACTLDVDCIQAKAVDYRNLSGSIIEADMRFNDNLLWSDSGGVPGQSYDVQNVATHEFGHWLRLDHVQLGDTEQTMYHEVLTGEIKKRTLEWGDLAGVRFIYPVTSSVPGPFGDETQGTDIAIRDVNKNGRLDVVILWVDDPSGANTIYYKIGWDIDVQGNVASTAWTSRKTVRGPDGTGDFTAGAGVALSDINSNGNLDMLVFWIDARGGADTMYYRIGWDIDTSGNIASSSWTAKKTVGGNIGDSTAGGGATLANIDTNSRPDLVVTWIDNPSGGNNMYYRIGWNIDTSGNICGSCWSTDKTVATGIGDESDGAGVAYAAWLSDEFSETMLRQWTFQSGSWGLENGELSGGPGGGSGSVAFGTLITLAEGAKIPVQSLEIGDRLLLFDVFTHSSYSATLTMIRQVTVDNMLTIHAANGLPLRVDANPGLRLYVMTDSGPVLRSVLGIRPGDLVYNYDMDAWVPVQSVSTSFDGRHDFYDLVTDPYLTSDGNYLGFIANGYADPCESPCKLVPTISGSRIVTTETFPSDRVFDVRMKTVDPGTDSDHVAWVSGKYVDQSNKISLGIHTTSTIELALTYQGATTIWTTGSSLNPLDWHTVRMQFDGNTVFVYIDNVRYFLETDTRIGALGDSKVQLSAAGYSHAHFDDVVIDDPDTHLTLVFTWVDDPAFNNEMYYKVAWNTQISGNPSSWSAVKWTPGKGVGSFVGIGDFTQGAGIAVADINSNGFLELVFAWMDNPGGANQVKYRIEWEGRVDSHQNA